MRSPLAVTARAALLAGAVLASACDNAGSDLGLEVSATNSVSVGVYLDRDGSRTLTGLDTAFAGARVALLVRGSSDTVAIVTTLVSGIALFESVPLGQYRVVVVSSSIGDSIQVQSVGTGNIRVEADAPTTEVLVRLGYPEVSIRAARALPAGQRVFIRGIILSGVQSFRDTTSHVADSSGQLRLTRVSLRGGLTGNAPGDSVSVLGVTSSRAGQATLDNAVIARFNTRPAPIPFAIGSGTAANANSGVLDAALVLVTAATISDTSTVAPDFRVRATDGTGTLTILLDGAIPFARANFRPNRSMNVTGVLVPDGAGGWVLKPRTTGDVIFNN